MIRGRILKGGRKKSFFEKTFKKETGQHEGEVAKKPGPFSHAERGSGKKSPLKGEKERPD